MQESPLDSSSLRERAPANDPVHLQRLLKTPMYTLLSKINSPADLKKIKPEDLTTLSAEIREMMIKTVSSNGGHLASSLGVVELSIALHTVFDSPQDKIIWDVGHQSYAHKLLTGRRSKFHTLRQYDGISGFPDPGESPHDAFPGGHAGNSISAALGMALARDLDKKDFGVVAVIGDGSLGSGMALEAVNHAGHMGTAFTLVLNDNGMSISNSVGSICRLLNKVRCAQTFVSINEKLAKKLPWLYLDGLFWNLGNRIKNRLIKMMMLNALWDEMGFNYIGPVDGHDIKELMATLRRARGFKSRPTILHVITTKGKGYEPAEHDAVRYHGVSPIKKEKTSAPTYSQVFSKTVIRLMEENPRVVAITAAMLDGTGLEKASQIFPGRVFDVGICEQHAVTLAAGLATQGFIPIVAIYSTFLQRAYDQIVNDVCIMKLPVIFAVDRAGIVGDDGKTHQGAFDVSFMRSVPHMIVSAPKNEDEFQHLLYTAVNAGAPMAVRYPRGSGPGASLEPEFRELPIGKGEILRFGSDIAILAFGATVRHALAAADQLAAMGISCSVANARYAKPLDEDLISELARKTGKIITVEENVIGGGFGSAVAELLKREEGHHAQLECLGLPDMFLRHGTQDQLRSIFDLDAAGIVRKIKQSFPELVLNLYNRKVENIV
jgi:1-deoxy-D-xylulose-5-phosphate synthase